MEHSRQFAAEVEGPQAVRSGQVSSRDACPVIPYSQVFPRGPSALTGRLSSDCPIFELEAEAGQFYRPISRRDAATFKRGILWSVIFSAPFWLVAGIIVLQFRK